MESGMMIIIQYPKRVGMVGRWATAHAVSLVMPTCGKSNEGTGKKVGTFSYRHPLLRPCAHVAPQRTMKEKTMSLLVLHMDKFKKDAVRGIQSHNRRERESHSNPDID